MLTGPRRFRVSFAREPVERLSGIADDHTRHKTIDQSEEQWVVRDVHTNSIEGAWLLFERSIVGFFRKVSIKHIDRDLEELEWRFNNRDNGHIFADTLRRIMTPDRFRTATW